MEKLSITLTSSQKSLIDAEVAAGRYASTSEYIRDALREREERAEFEAWLINRHELSVKAEAEGNLISHEEVFADIRSRIGLDT